MNTEDLRPDVVAGHYDPSKFNALGLSLLVNEMFYSIQGEGRHAGDASLFIRLAKCNLACKFCDTEFETGQVATVDEIVGRAKQLVEMETYRGMRPQVTITGGEPLIQNCGPLVEKLKAEDFYVTVETSGSVFAEWVRMVDWVTCSPKVKFTAIPQELLMRVREMKWIVNDAFLKGFERDRLSYWMGGDVLNYLQPEWGPHRERYTAAAIKLVKRYPTIYKLGLQQYKFAGVA